MFRIIIQLILFLFPWNFRRFFLNYLFDFEIDKSARIGFSIILSDSLIMKANSSINHFSLCKRINLLQLNEYSRIGTFNFITGYPENQNKFFGHIKDRKCVLFIDKHSAITSRHFLDCTAGIFIGKYTTFAGLRSVILTHSIDTKLNRQHAMPVIIGSYCFVGTCSTLLGGCQLPDYSILGAKSLLNKKLEEEEVLYGGVPCKKIKKISKDEYKYLSREMGFVY